MSARVDKHPLRLRSNQLEKRTELFKLWGICGTICSASSFDGENRFQETGTLRALLPRDSLRIKSRSITEEDMRLAFVVLALLFSGCKSAEFMISHPGTGVQFVARLVPPDVAPPHPDSLVVGPAVATTPGKREAGDGH